MTKGGLVGREPVSRGGAGGVGLGQAALAVVVVAGAALGALLLRPGGGYGKGTGPLGGSTGVVVLLSLVWAVGGFWLGARYRSRARSDLVLGPVESRLAETVRYAFFVLPIAVPVLALSLHRSRAGSGAAPNPEPPGKPRISLGEPTPPHFTRPRTSSRGKMDLGLLLHILIGIGIALFVVLVVVAAVLLWRLLGPSSEPPPVGTYSVIDDEQRRLAEAVDSGRRALLDGDDARAAVIACYAAMERSLAASGVARKASDSPHDLLARVTGSGLLTGTSASALTELFREARYSTHPMDAGHRDRAAAALTDIAARLEAHRPDGGRPDADRATAEASP
ncbi:DUF4129 domain-containing protein [Streptomyces polygonati]|uniref:DUF4129 domain-containing protein n=1 Tax=Streptomyces polygonati TaxID=1617087 RepID=A0ABV8HI96_9ACTN